MKKLVIIIIVIVVIIAIALILQYQYSYVTCLQDNECSCDCCDNCYNYKKTDDRPSCPNFCVAGPGPAKCKWSFTGSKCAPGEE